MKRLLAAIFGKPKIVIPIVLIIAGIGTAHMYRSIGQAPVVSLSTDAVADPSFQAQSKTVSLSFVKAGKIAAVQLTLGAHVKKGDILASLDASDAQGLVNQARGAVELAKAQYASLDVQYAHAKSQQDTLVANAYRTLLSSGLAAVAAQTVNGYSGATVDSAQAPQITGTYTCGKEGSYEIDPYQSGSNSGYSFTFKGLESGTANATNYTSQPLGTCGLYVQFPVGYNSTYIRWIVIIPNTASAGYAANKNAYDAALATHDQVLGQLEANLGKNGSNDANLAQAGIDSANGTYEAALAAYNNDLIVAPADGVVESVDPSLQVGNSAIANKTLITIVTN